MQTKHKYKTVKGLERILYSAAFWNKEALCLGYVRHSSFQCNAHKETISTIFWQRLQSSQTLLAS